MDSLTIGCYFWEHGCKVDWPAWVQAVGSVIAIFVAVGLARWQYYQSKAAILERKKAQLYLGMRFVQEVNDIFNSAYVAINAGHILGINRLSTKLEDLLIWSRSFAFDTYDMKTIHSFVMIRSAAADLMIWGKDLDITIKVEAISVVKSTYKNFSRELPNWATRKHDWALPEDVVE